MSNQDDSENNKIVELDLLKNPELFIIDFEELPLSYSKFHADRGYVSDIRSQV